MLDIINMTDKEKRLKALKNLKENLEGLIEVVKDTTNDESDINQLLEDLFRIMNEIQVLENEIKNSR
jgi:ferritin